MKTSDKYLPEGERYLYDVLTSDGDLYLLLSHYQLELVKSIYSMEIRERLNHTYSLKDYSVKSIINKEREIKFLNDVFNSILKDEFNVTHLITSFANEENTSSFNSTNPFCTEDCIDNYRRAYKYLIAQYTENKFNIYANLLCLVLNNRIKAISMSDNTDIINQKSSIFIKCDTNDVTNFINEFVDMNIDVLDCKEVSEIYLMFSDFLSTKR